MRGTTGKDRGIWFARGLAGPALAGLGADREQRLEVVLREDLEGDHRLRALMPLSSAKRCVTTSATSSGLRTRSIATKSHSPVTEYASATPSTSASAPPRVEIASRSASMRTIAWVT